MINPVDIILKKRAGLELTKDEIDAFVRGSADGACQDYQVAAFLMAVAIRGMTDREIRDLTMSMAHSGETLDLSAISGPKVDKHSTGGVGDTTTLILAPLVAVCGAKVAKMSGRGLGHTGGTLDKLESIPGFRVDLSVEQFVHQVNDIGCAVIGQTKSLAPADKVFYALRDVTGTVDSLPLIVSSILSKKIAAGCDAVVLDVKTGTGAIMPTISGSIELATKMVAIGNMTGRRFSALVTDMDQPLGLNVGNALEVEEAIDVLAGNVKGDLLDVSLKLGTHMLLSTRRAATVEQGTEMLLEALRSGAGLRKLAEMIEAQGGNPEVVRRPELLPQAPESSILKAETGGYVSRMHTERIGNAARALGAGRARKEDDIDPSVGILMKKRLGDRVEAGEALCELRISPKSDVERALQLLDGAFETSESPVDKPPLIHAVIGA
jgi:pyrimidine-nucleoside phosphorylase